MWKELGFKAVIFDLDGVVIDTAEPIESFWKKWGRAKGIDIDENTLAEAIHGCPALQTVNLLFDHLTAEEKQDILTDGEKMEANLTYKPMAGVLDFLKLLVAKNIKIALVTSSLPEKVGEVFRQVGLHSFFKEVVTADKVEKGKPDPACYRLAAKKLGILEQHCLVFEDSLSGTTAAAKAGMHVIGVNKPYMEENLKNAGASIVIPDFTQASSININDGVSTFTFFNHPDHYSLGEIDSRG